MPDPSTPPPFGPSFGPLPRADLVSLVRADQRHNWQRGERVAAEAYLERLPFLQNDHAALLDLIVDEVQLRAEAGEPCSLDEYRRRFPQLAGPLVWRLALHRSAVGTVLANDDGQVPRLSAAPGPEPADPQPYEPIPIERTVDEQPTGADLSPAGQTNGPLGRGWQWCRRHPAPATMLTAAAACVLFGVVAAPFAGRASSTAPPADVPVAADAAELLRVRDRADRADRELADLKNAAAVDRAARDQAVQLKSAAEDRAASASATAAELRRSIDGLFADLAERATSSTPAPARDRILTAAQAHYEALVKDAGDDPARQAERARSLVRLGHIAEARGKTAEAAGHLRQAIAALSTAEVGADSKPVLAAAHQRLARLERQAGRLPEAEAAGRKAVDLWAAIGKGAPNDTVTGDLADSLDTLAQTLADAKRFDDAAAANRQLIDLSQKSATGADLAGVWERLADCLANAGQVEQAAVARGRAVELLRQQIERSREDTGHAEALARNLTTLATTLKEPAASAPAYEESITAWERVARLRPALEPRVKIAKALDRLADLQGRLGDRDAADRTADRAIMARERLVAEHPGHAESLFALAAAYTARGERLRDKAGDNEGAAADFRRTVPLLEELVKQSPQSREYVTRLAINEMCVAQLDLRGRKYDAARAGFNRALDRLDKLAASDDVTVNRGVCCVNLGQLAVMDRPPKEAREWFDRAEQLLSPLAEHPDWKAFVAGALADVARGREQLGDKRK